MGGDNSEGALGDKKPKGAQGGGKLGGEWGRRDKGIKGTREKDKKESWMSFF